GSRSSRMTGCSTSGQRSRVHTTRHSSCATCTGRCVAEHRSAIGRDRRADPRVHHVSERPRLLILVTLAEAGGAQTFVAALAEGLKERYHIDVAAHGPEGALADACARLGLPFHHIPSLRRAPHPWRDFRAGLEIRRLVERVRPDIIQVNSSKAGFVARIALPKNLQALLIALAQPGLEPWRLRIIGDGPDRPRLEAQRAALGLGHRVEMLGERRDVDAQLIAADAFVLPSDSEGLPYS